jgi:hypothetical protein
LAAKGYSVCSAAKTPGKQNLTISLDRQTIRKARILAARRLTSVSELLADRIELLAGQEETYEGAEHQARRLLDQGFHFGNPTLAERDKLHER